MTRNEIITTIQSHLPLIKDRFSVQSLSVFGSASHALMNEDSDVDVLVTFDGPATFDRYFSLKFYLEELFKREVDLATDKMIKPRFRKHIEKELIHVA